MKLSHQEEQALQDGREGFVCNEEKAGRLWVADHLADAGYLSKTSVDDGYEFKTTPAGEALLRVAGESNTAGEELKLYLLEDTRAKELEEYDAYESLVVCAPSAIAAKYMLRDGSSSLTPFVWATYPHEVICVPIGKADKGIARGVIYENYRHG